MTYATQRDAITRTRQDLVVLGVRECQNAYSIDNLTIQWMRFSAQYENAAWVKTSVTVTGAFGNTIEDPEGFFTAEEIIFNAANDSIHQVSVGGAGVVTSKAFTGSVWLKIPTGTETVTIRVMNVAGTETGDLQVTLTTTWQRFFVHKLFSAVPVDNVVFKIIRLGGDTVTTLHAWHANLSQNIGNQNAVRKWPTRANVDGTSVSLVVNLASRCTATNASDGARCHYSRPTCQDPDNFNAGNVYELEPRLIGIREYRLCRKDAALPLPGEDVYPYLVGVPTATQKIEAERSVTQNERMTFEFEDDQGPGLWNPRQQVEGFPVNTQTGAGSFWRRWVTINRNYSNDECYAIRKVGFVEAGGTEAEYQQRGKYLMRRFMTDDRSVKLQCADRLKLTRKELPGKLSDTNMLTVPMGTAETVMVITAPDEIPTPAPDADSAAPSYYVTIEIEPDTANAEKVNVTSVGLSVDEIVVFIQRGRWGTTARTHPVQSEIRLIYEFGTERDEPSGVPLGKNPIDCVLEMYRYAGLAEAEIDRAAFEADRDVWLPSSVNGTTGASYGSLLRRTLTEVTEIESLITEIRELTGLMVWVSAGSMVTGRLFAPVLPGASVATLTDDANIISGSVSMEDDDEERISRVLIGWDLATGEDGAQAEDYERIRLELDVDAESRGYYGESRLKVLLTKWLELNVGAEGVAEHFTSQIMSRFRHGRRLLKVELNIKDDDIDTGDPIDVTTSHIQDAHGNDYTGRMYVMSRKIAGSRISVEAIDTFGVLERAWFYADAVPVSYDAATAAQRLTAFLADSTGMVGTGANTTTGYKAT